MEDAFTVHSGTANRVLLTANERIEAGENVPLDAEFIAEMLDAMGYEDVWRKRFIQCEKECAGLRERNKNLLGNIRSMKASAD